jgi:spore coat polysaccharide biosynthesis protein SpsF
MSSFLTEQEAFWAGDFGKDYIRRNQGEELLATNLNFFVRALANSHGVKSCIEFGANIGMNLRALRLLYPNQEQYAIEINEEAVNSLKEILPEDHIHHGSILGFNVEKTCDLALIKGVLIHINPDVLPQVYDKLVAATNRYLLVCEYYNPVPVSIDYRGHKEKLFKRDFAGEIMDRHAGMQLVDYGFTYHRDPDFLHGDISWFLMQKTDSKGYQG